VGSPTPHRRSRAIGEATRHARGTDPHRSARRAAGNVRRITATQANTRMEPTARSGRVRAAAHSETLGRRNQASKRVQT
jgi:hypothetical protein